MAKGGMRCVSPVLISLSYSTNPHPPSHLPSTSSLETLVLFSSISTADPDGPTSIHQTMTDLVQSRIRTTIISLSGEIKICRQICERTGGRFGVAIDEEHLRELMWETIPPPAQTIGAPATLGVRHALAAGGQGIGSGQRGGMKPPPVGDLMVMGFPVRLPQGGESLCACHGLLRKGGYLCPRCGSKMCDVPTDCDVCGLMVVSSPHLARRCVVLVSRTILERRILLMCFYLPSFWFLFPVANFGVLGIPAATERETHGQLATRCFGCDKPFPAVNLNLRNSLQSLIMVVLFQLANVGTAAGVNQVDDTVSPTSRYRYVNRGFHHSFVYPTEADMESSCSKCQNDFCMDCDLYIHHTLHTCPACAQ